jgi:ABC-type ATPase with predicted acetyltransferase domain
MICFACEKEITDTTWYAPDKEDNALVICNKCYDSQCSEWVERPDCDCCGSSIDDHFNEVNGKTLCDNCWDVLLVQQADIVIPEDEIGMYVFPVEPYPNQIGLC